ncbi:AMP-binding enzyme [Streptomyces sp. TRM49041]|uniref:AMP-binding enzyme n=1 Tax=Streptomyces sp. TRM49041 TaxID=2603216 RepID=UPI0037DA1733
MLNSHPRVRQSAVFGVPDADRMERVHAAVVPAPGASPTAAALTALVRARCGRMYEPSHIVFLDALPLTDAGKPDKKRLREFAAPPLKPPGNRRWPRWSDQPPAWSGPAAAAPLCIRFVTHGT